MAMYLLKENVKGSKVYNIIIDIYGETKLKQEVGRWTWEKGTLPIRTRTLKKENRAYLDSSLFGLGLLLRIRKICLIRIASYPILFYSDHDYYSESEESI